MTVVSNLWLIKQSLLLFIYLNPDKTFKSVVLPLPDGPRTAISWPASNFPERFFKICLSGLPVLVYGK